MAAFLSRVGWLLALGLWLYALLHLWSVDFLFGKSVESREDQVRVFALLAKALVACALAALALWLSRT